MLRFYLIYTILAHKILFYCLEFVIIDNLLIKQFCLKSYEVIMFIKILRLNMLFFSLLAHCVFATPNVAKIKPIDFSLFKLEALENTKSPTLLLIGGIQGDEPGGFNATNIFLNHYKITNGSVWIIPVINPHSMLFNHRGLYDDMNRKFAYISPNDAEISIIKRVKSIITDSQVDVILHLHDGSGFFRHTHQSELLSPKRWGNCTIIDQEKLDGVRFGELDEIATYITKRINAKILKPLHEYRVRNTKTAKEDKEMQKALTFYAIKEGKAAFANEASKTLNLKERVYYHLLAIEALLEKVGIEFKRDFELSVEGVGKVIYDKNLHFSIENMPPFPLFDLRDEIADLPLPKGKTFDKITLDSSTKILGFLPRNNALVLKYGNNVMTRFIPKYVEFATNAPKDLPSKYAISANIDGKKQNIPFGNVIKIKESIEIENLQEYKIKVIGLKNSGLNKPQALQTGQTTIIKKENLNPLASIDKAGNLYRIEFYTKPNNASATQHQNTHYATLESHTTNAPQNNTNSAKDTRKTAQVIASSAFVRSEATEFSPFIAKAPRGRKLYVLSTQKALESSKEGGAWAKVEYDFGGRKISGFILERLLSYGDFVVDLSLDMQDIQKTQSSTTKTTKGVLEKEIFEGMILLDFTP